MGSQRVAQEVGIHARPTSEARHRSVMLACRCRTNSELLDSDKFRHWHTERYECSIRPIGQAPKCHPRKSTLQQAPPPWVTFSVRNERASKYRRSSAG